MVTRAAAHRIHAPSAGGIVFAASLIAAGIAGFVTGNVAPVWEPVPTDFPFRALLADLCAALSLAAGVGLLTRRGAAVAARTLLGALLAWFLAFRLPVIFQSPRVAVTWEGCAETAVVVVGAWMLHARYASPWDRRNLGLTVGERAVRVARRLFGACLIPFGIAHFAYLEMTASLVPHWIPFPHGWVVFTGIAYLAAGAAMLSGICARLAAMLATLQMGSFTLLVWAPAVANAPRDVGVWSETIVSCALSASAWLVAESYRETHQVAQRFKRRS